MVKHRDQASAKTIRCYGSREKTAVIETWLKVFWWSIPGERKDEIGAAVDVCITGRKQRFEGGDW